MPNDFATLSREWLAKSIDERYSYNFTWLGRPIIQYPQDICCVQELFWSIKPDLVIETGIAHGGSIVLSASLLALLDVCEAIEAGVSIDPAKSKRKVVAVDIDIRAHNRAAIEAHPMASRIHMIEGSSIDPKIIEKVKRAGEGHERVLVLLDSMHTHSHVLAELEAYSPLVSIGSYIVVFDTIIEDMPRGYYKDRPWDVGDNPRTAVFEFLRKNPHFEINRDVEKKLAITVARDGFLERVR